jgi:hypothetical protein
MYYKLYRRRQYIYLGLFIAGILFLMSQKSEINNNSRHTNDPNHGDENPNIPHMHIDKPVGGDGSDDPVPPKKTRVNMQNYKEPPICKGCPGENGAGVFLNVIDFDF